MHKIGIAILCLLLKITLVSGQSLPVGSPMLTDALRRAQLLGQVDSSISFTVLPLFPQKALKTENSFDPFNTLTGERWGKSAMALHFWGKNGKIQLLPITIQQQFNTHHPFSLNDGAMIPARGYQTLIRGGLYAQAGPLSIQLNPEYIYAANNDFQGFYKEFSDAVWTEYYRLYNNIDLPEKFGDKPYQKTFWGQSSIRLTAGPLSLGLSSENLWWGPGIRNSLLMSNSAPGFLHFTVNTVKPIRTFLGNFEGQIICGRLENSGFFPPDTSRTNDGTKLYISKRDDWRYINGYVLSYHPKWVPGLFLGINTTHMVYHEDLGNSFRDYFPIFSSLTKKSNYGEGESEKPNDQRLSIFTRWLWAKAHAELYVEYFREDHAFDLRDMILQIEHTHAWMFGIQKMIPLTRTNEYIQLQVEATKLEQTTTNPERPTGSVYLHYAGISHGYSNYGQLLGAGIGPGSNMQTLAVSWVKQLKTIGIELNRVVQNNDLHNHAIKDPRANWVDLNIAAFGTWNYKNLLLSAKCQFINSYNYQHYYQPLTDKGDNSYWVPGKNTFNFQMQLSTSYRF